MSAPQLRRSTGPSLKAEWHALPSRSREADDRAARRESRRGSPVEDVPGQSVDTERNREAGTERVRALAELLGRRDDLRGVHAHADLVDELSRWCA